MDGLELSDEDRASYSRQRALLEIGRPMSQGDLGCALSHLKIYRKMVADRIPELIVMEDDAVPSRDLPHVVDAVRDLATEWDVVTFNSFFESARPRPIDDRQIAGRYSICRFDGMSFGTQGYLIRLSAARHLLEVGIPGVHATRRPAVSSAPRDVARARDRAHPARARRVPFGARGLAEHRRPRLDLRDRAVVNLGKGRRRGWSIWDRFARRHDA